MDVNTLIDEEDLITKAKADPAQFRALYDLYFKDVFNFIFRRIDQKEIAKDITQQVFLKALQSLKDYVYKGTPFSSYLCRIAINECNQFFRDIKKVRYVTINEGFQDSMKAEIGSSEQMDTWLTHLSDALGTLKMDQLMLIELRFFEKRSFKEIGSILEITENLAKVRTYRILKKLKIHFQTSDEE